MAWMAAAGSTLLSLYGANKQAGAAKDAANISAAAAREQTQLQRDIFNQQQANQAPYLAAGTNALAQLREGTAPGGQFTRNFGMQDYQADPGYAFRLSEGLKQLGSQARAQGGAGGGRTMMGIQNYAQGLASQEYGNAFNRYQTNRANQLQPLQSLAGIGQTANNALAQGGQSYANQAGQYGMINAANQGNAALSAGNAYGSAYSGIGNALGRMNSSGGGNPFSSLFGYNTQGLQQGYDTGGYESTAGVYAP
jgi:hypothetical protein